MQVILRLRRYCRNKLTQGKFMAAARCNAAAIRLLFMAQRLVSKQLYAFEAGTYRAELLELHRKIAHELKQQRRGYKALKYSYGYPYQALHTLGVFGARSTEDRWHAYGLADHIRSEHRILDIGCNCGFMSLYSVYRTGCRADGVDINPFMLNIGRHCAEMLKINDRLRLIQGDFGKCDLADDYDVVFSFAAHYTEDGQHRPDLREYLERIHGLLAPGGLLIFESHGFDMKRDEFQKQIWAMEGLFKIEQHRTLFGGNRELFLFRRVDTVQPNHTRNVAHANNTTSV